jgi:hypothetical protein
MPSRKFKGIGNLHRPNEPLNTKIRRRASDDDDQDAIETERQPLPLAVLPETIDPAMYDVEPRTSRAEVPLLPARNASSQNAGLHRPEAVEPIEPISSMGFEANPSLDRVSSSHSAAADEVYRAMYAETIAQGIAERSFSHSDLRNRLTRRNAITFARAVEELTAKRSIEPLSGPMGRHGRMFRIHTPEEIERLRAEAGIRIDPKSRRVIPHPKVS